MRILASTAGALEIAARREVEPRRTPVSVADLRAAIDRAHKELTGRVTPTKLLDVLTAHASLETGSGGQMYNYNFGGIKGRSPTGETARCRTKEVVDGREIEVRDGFRAYRTLDEGARDYVRLMRSRFGAAMAHAAAGDVAGFAHALKEARYYTADEAKYASALERLTGNAASHERRGAGARVAAAGPRADLDFADALALGRVLDAIARHPARVEEEEDD